MIHATKVSFLLLMLSFSSHLAFSQDQGEIDEQDSLVENGADFQWAVYIEGQLEILDFDAQNAFSSYYGGGIEYKKISLGIFYNELRSEVSKHIIFPNTFKLRSANGGAYVGLRILQKGPLEVQSRLNFARGDVLWESLSTQEAFVRQKFNILKPELILSYNPTIITKFYLLVGYKYVSDFELVGIGAQDLGGVNVGIGIKLGFFHKPE